MVPLTQPYTRGRVFQPALHGLFTWPGGPPALHIVAKQPKLAIVVVHRPHLDAGSVEDLSSAYGNRECPTVSHPGTHTPRLRVASSSSYPLLYGFTVAWRASVPRPGTTFWGRFLRFPRGVQSGQWGRKPTLDQPYLPMSPLQEMDQWVWGMEGSAFYPKVLITVATCELRTVKKHILGSFLDYLAQ